MKTYSLRRRVVGLFLALVLLLGSAIFVFGYVMIKKNIIDRAQRQVQNDLKAARSVWDNELEQMRNGFDLITVIRDPALLKTQLGLDYLFVVERTKADSIHSLIVKAAFGGNSCGGPRIIDSVELSALDWNLQDRARIQLQPTPLARPTMLTKITTAMVVEYAAPYFDSTGHVVRVIYGGKIINRYFRLIDKIHDIVYENRLYKNKPMGTVTIFLNDVRIATNVVAKEGARAIGTRVSEAVFHNVVEQGRPWLDRAFVVTDWYLTAYEPIRDFSGEIIGILYVGTLEQPFRDMIRQALAVFALIIGGCAALAIIISVVLASAILTPLTRLVSATASLADGDLSHRIPNNMRIREIHDLAEAFNHMAGSLDERETSLKRVNNDLDVLNKRYIDLVGMVSHELKGILASTVLNAYTVCDGYLGPLNDCQKKALTAVTRNLDYFNLTVTNFLNLSRIEKGELTVNRSIIRLGKDIAEVSIDAFTRQAEERAITIVNDVPADLQISGDSFLLLTVINNCIGNAVKYGARGGTIIITARDNDASRIVEIYNDGRPFTASERDQLFKRFVRLDTPEGRQARGTGLGLFLCKEIVERHGNTIWCESREKGNAFLLTVDRV
jgi:two-component system NtrC family sensor kinase